MFILRTVSALLMLLSVASTSPVTCETPGVECEYNEENYIDTETQVPSEEECRSICEDQDQCQFITYFNSSASPFSNICRSLKSCDSVVPCEKCVSQKVGCFKKPCSFNIIGKMDENILDISFGVESEIECKNLCSDMDECSWYTFFYSNSSVSHDTCTLLTELVPPLETSNTAVSGPSDCSIEPCTLLLNGGAGGYKSLMLTDTKTDIRIDVIVQDLNSCELIILSVGAGGHANNGGGGSGYLKYQSLSLQPGVAIINATVGMGAHDWRVSNKSSVSIHESGRPGIISITAEGGQDGKGDMSFGGDGYSGGGGGDCQGSSGGSNGSDGDAEECSNAGHGTREDISEYRFTSWTLTPGAGGDYYSYSSTSCGGGGGVMINGEGPEATQYHGRGFGGGGGFYSNHGLQGVILLEIG